jgi:hypothetical protein
LQDIVKVAGAAADYFRVKKYDPWQATPNVELATPTFLDPTRQLAANAEMANIGTEGASVFSGPQAFNARFSQIQGQAAQNAANILSGVHNANVQIANQFEDFNTQVMNNASNQKANLATQLYDKNTIANQQFDNEKAMARQNLRQSYIDAITNRGLTQATNSMYDNYKVLPNKGGFVVFPHGKPIKPSNVNQSSVAEKFAAYKRQFPGIDDDTALKMAKLDMGIDDETPKVNPAQFAYPGSF